MVEPLAPECQEAPRNATAPAIVSRTYFDDDEMRLRRVQREAGWMEAPEQSWHRLWLHARAVDERLRFGDDRYSGRTQRGASTLCPAGVAATAAWDTPVDVLALAISPAFCARVLENEVWFARPFFHLQDVVVSQILGLLSRGSVPDEPHDRLYREALVTALVSHLARDMEAVRRSVPHGGLAPNRLRRVITYLDDHLAEDVPLAALAEQAGLSERHFCTMFGRATGRPPHRFLVERRLERAGHLLRSRPSQTVTGVAMEVGFKSSAHFSNAFRKVFGRTPSAYREDR